MTNERLISCNGYQLRVRDRQLDLLIDGEEPAITLASALKSHVSDTQLRSYAERQIERAGGFPSFVERYA